MRFISRRRAGAAEAGIAKIVAALYRSARQCSAVFISAPAGREETLLAILTNVQCHQPLPVGASGSRTVTAKLRVPAGAFFHVSCGETLPPVQPKPVNQCFWASGCPSRISLLLTLNGAAIAPLLTAATIATTIRIPVFIVFSSWGEKTEYETPRKVNVLKRLHFVPKRSTAPGGGKMLVCARCANLRAIFRCRHSRCLKVAP